MTNKSILFHKKAFTVVEALVVSLVVGMILVFLISFFTHTVKYTEKGVDAYDSYKAANRLFFAIRDDLINSSEYYLLDPTSGAKAPNKLLSSPDETIQDNDSAFTSSMRIIQGEIATITYELDVDHINRIQEKGGNISTQEFGLPRILEFGLMKVEIPHSPQYGSDFSSSHLCARVEIDSKDIRFPSTHVTYSFVFSPHKHEDLP